MADSFVTHLRETLLGEVRDDPGTRAVYATDGSNHRVLPRCVILPRTDDDVRELTRICAAEGVVITSRGAGTNCAGSAVGPGAVVDFSRHMNTIGPIDLDAESVRVQPGVVLDRLQERVLPAGLLFGVDPSTHSRCTLGGMIGTNACGSHSVAWGSTADNVLGLEVVLPDGTTVSLGSGAAGVRPAETALAARVELVRGEYATDIALELGRFGRQISGYGLQYLLADRGRDLAKAFVGSEGTCGIVTSATLRLQRRPALRALVVLGYAQEFAAATAAVTIAATGALTVEGIDEQVVRTSDQRLGSAPRPDLPRGTAWLLVELGGSSRDELHHAAGRLVALARDLESTGSSVHTDAAEQRAIWAIRERGAGLASRSAEGREFWPGWEDSAVPPIRLGGYLRDLRALMAEHGRQGMVYGHFGEGCVHVRIDHDLLSESGRGNYRRFQEDAADLVVSHGGSLSGEHGDGRARSELLSRMYGARIVGAFAAFKAAFDPDGLMNPGIIVDPEPLDANLRGEHSKPYTKDLGFIYPQDSGDFGKALRRCTGVGACRKTSGGGMCPSYRATQEESNSTRGRARLLAEMLDGEVIADGWKSDAVEAALDLCLSCKVCSSECPVGVDMATYKAEFLHQRYRRRLRPRSHYSMGWLPVFLAIGRRAPRLGNRLMGLAPVAALAKVLGGIDRRRTLPRLAEDSFPRWHRSHRGPDSGEPIVLWVDSFTASFSPEIARAAVLVLEAAGYRVELAPSGVCCGLTWVSTGQLGTARKKMRRSAQLLDSTIPDAPIVALEPSCGTALRHDATNLVGGDQVARVAGRIRSLAEVLADREVPFRAGRVEAVAQFHCHQRATFGTTADRTLLAAAGVELHSVDEGCCGLAGNFGFEAGHYEVSVACAEEALLPALAGHSTDQPVLADGYSCRLQIEQLDGRKATHLAELLLEQLSNPGQEDRT